MERVTCHGWILIFALLTGWLCPSGVQGQAFERNVAPSSVISHRGPNRLHYSHAYLGGSLIPSGTISGGGSHVTNLSAALSGGYRYKLKLIRPLALVGELGLESQGYRIKPGSFFLAGDTSSFLRQTVRVASINGGVFLRLRFGQRGNYLGNFLDLGVQGMIPFHTRQVTIRQSTGSTAPSLLTESRISHRLDCVQPVNFSMLARIGLDRTAIVVKWRWSELTDGTTNFDLPRLQVGLELALVSY